MVYPTNCTSPPKKVKRNESITIVFKIIYNSDKINKKQKFLVIK